MWVMLADGHSCALCGTAAAQFVAEYVRQGFLQMEMCMLGLGEMGLNYPLAISPYDSGDE
jgi:hypothetical protein